MRLRNIEGFSTTAEFHNHLKKLLTRQSFNRYALQKIVDHKVHLRRQYHPIPN